MEIKFTCFRLKIPLRGVLSVCGFEVQYDGAARVIVSHESVGRGYSILI